MNLSKEYFTNITQEVEKIITFYESLCNNEDFLSKVKEKALPYWHIDSIKELIFDCFFQDLARCLVGLGYDINLKTKETFGFFYFYARYHNKGLKNEYTKSIALFDNYFYDTVEDTLKKINNDKVKISVGEDIFSMCSVLKDFADDDHKQKYLIMLYRYASLTAITK
ncbi:MAG: hypothetical protein FWC10_09910 [Lentimicrobiaceae bacterium]|nr:hypothetical protein [Lentimicrobiaceae bacterium]